MYYNIYICIRIIMFLYKKLLILIILVIFSYILFLLLKKRREIFSNKEGLALNSSGVNEVTKMTSKIPSGIMSVKPDNSNLQLLQYCIKSSYNSAVSGQYVSVNAIKYVLSRGCRFLDFEVYFIDNAPVVAFSTDPTFITITSKNSITLNSALQAVITNGFSGPSPNGSDPLFIQLRIKSNNPLIYNMTGQAIQNYLASKLYIGTVDGTTVLSELLGKAILIIDKSIAPNYTDLSNYPKCNNTMSAVNSGCYNLTTFMNMESGTGILRMYSYTNLLAQATTPPTLLDSDNLDTDVSLLRIAEPDTTDPENSNPSPRDFMKQYGVQFLTNRFFITGSNLTLYEQFFSDNKSSFVPFATTISYYP
jgi:hypothetical protein